MKAVIEAGAKRVGMGRLVEIAKNRDEVRVDGTGPSAYREWGSEARRVRRRLCKLRNV